MLKVYYLPVVRDEITNTISTQGSEYISGAIDDATALPEVRRVIIEENPILALVALKVEPATAWDVERHASLKRPPSTQIDIPAVLESLSARLSELEKRL